MDAAMAASLIRPREADSHKGTYGHALLVAGSRGMAGAALMASRACLRSGVGLLTVAVPECNRIIQQTAVPEAMAWVSGDDQLEAIPADLSRYTAVAAGPGLGRIDWERLSAPLSSLPDTIPCVLDADALNALSCSAVLSDSPSDSAVDGRKGVCLGGSCLMTPHPGEFDRLLHAAGMGTYDAARRVAQASAFAARYGVYVVLKGHRTVIAAPDGRLSVNTTGNAGMATGGSGDVLTGILLALCAQGYPLWDAARLGVYVHGLAGDLAAVVLGEVALTACDIIGYLPAAWQRLTASRS